ncbi:MAG: glycosyltransferase family 39 protein [Oscillospiraceae bacterium]|nr:glycosyltransferase family 39 protein [Oscillospiraceae bacterium]
MAKFAEKFESFARIVISILMIYIMGMLSIISLSSTTGMEIIGEGEEVDSVVIRIFKAQESVIFYQDDMLLNVIMLAVFGIICFLILPKMKKLTLRKELIFMTVWTLVTGVIWVNSSMVQPTFDSAYITEYAQKFASGDYSGMSDKYLQEYPFQLGYIFMAEIFYRIANANFGEQETTIFIQVINVVFLTLIYDGIILINHELFEDKRVRHVTVVLLTFCAQAVIFCSFTYGIIPGFAFAVWALYLEILYFRKNKIWMAIVSAICLALAVMIKNNNYIVVIAMMIIAVIQMLKRKNFLKDIAYIAVSVVMASSVLPLVTSHYEKKSGTELGDSMPYISWIAMGMCEGGRAPGWYRGMYSVTKFEELELNQEAMKAYSTNLLKERLEYFKENPQYRKDFFYRKFASQWNETSYQSIWNNTVRKQYKDKGKIAQWVCVDHVDAVKSYMDFYAQLIFWGCLISVIGCLKNKKNFLAVSMPLIVLGGIMYHMLSEAKSQYAMSYFIMMAGISAYGLCIMYDIFSKKMQKYPRLAGFFPVYEDKEEISEESKPEPKPET